MENKTEYGTFGDLLNSVDLPLQNICTILRDIILTLDQNYFEVVWKNQRIASYGVGPKKMSEHYVYIAPHKKHVNLGFYHGSALPDPHDLLEGTGKRLRHIKIKSEVVAKDIHVKELISEAIAKFKISL